MDVVQKVVTPRKKKKYKDYPDQFSSATHNVVLDRQRKCLRVEEKTGGNWSCEYHRRKDNQYLLVTRVNKERVTAPLIRRSFTTALTNLGLKPAARARAARWLDMTWKKANKRKARTSAENGRKNKSKNLQLN